MKLAAKIDQLNEQISDTRGTREAVAAEEDRVRLKNLARKTFAEAQGWRYAPGGASTRHWAPRGCGNMLRANYPELLLDIDYRDHAEYYTLPRSRKAIALVAHPYKFMLSPDTTPLLPGFHAMALPLSWYSSQTTAVLVWYDTETDRASTS